MLVIAFDVGVSGAIAFRAGEEVSVEDIPTEKITKGKHTRSHYKLAELADLLRSATDCGAMQAIAVVEHVGPMPHDGKIQAFTLGRGLGVLEGVLAGLGIEVILVTPRQWKKEMGLDSDKEKSRQLALELFPELASDLKRKKDHNRAESLLLLEWYRRNHG